MSGVTLSVDGPAWRTHLRGVAERTEGLVPVAKGNGYGFGLPRLAAESQALGCDVIAVGLPSEVAAVREHFDGDIVILTPWRADDHHAAEVARDPRVIVTVSRVVDLEPLAEIGGRPRLLLEVLTSMRRHGIAPDDLAVVDSLDDRLRFEGWVIHLPHVAQGRLEEATELARRCSRARTAPLWFSHLDTEDVQRIAAENRTTGRLRLGTSLWLGAPGTRRTHATVIDLHRVRKGERVGYWQRRITQDGWLVVIAGGTATGIGMEAPTSATSLRSRAIAVASGSLEAIGRALSPYTLDGRKRWFVEPPHMQSSLVLLPAGATPPAVGDEVTVEARLTTAVFDQVLISD